MVWPIRTTTDIITTDSAGNTVEAVAVYATDVPVQDAAGRWVDPVAAEESDVGFPVRLVDAMIAEDSTGRPVDATPIKGGGVQGLRFDFLTGVYPEPITFARTGTKYALNASGTFEQFDTDELARTDIGAVIEPAGAGKCLANANGTSTAWNKDAGLTGAAGTSGPIEGINFTTFTRASGNGRINQNPSITSGVTSKVVFVGRGDATFRYAVIRANAVAVGTYRNYVFDTQTLSVEYQGTGSTGPEIVALADGFFMASLEITAGHTGTSGHYFYLTNVEPTSDTFAAPTATGDWDFAYGDVLTQGSESLIISAGTAATRNADALTLPLGSGTRDLVFTFDDDTTQTFADETGDFAVPTNLDRPRVKYADWGSV